MNILILEVWRSMNLFQKLQNMLKSKHFPGGPKQMDLSSTDGRPVSDKKSAWTINLHGIIKLTRLLCNYKLCDKFIGN